VAEQLAFDLPARPALGRGDFFVSPSNAAAVAMVSDDEGWPLGKLALTGPEASGKSHLVHVWAAETGARIIPAHDLGSADIRDLAGAGRVAVEDIEDLGAGEAGEVPLFHLHNLLLASGGRLLVTGRGGPAHWPITLPDLRSRLQAVGLAKLSPPDDALLGAILMKQFADRQIAVSPALITYLVQRLDRSFAAAQDIVERLDAAALAEGRPVNRTLASRLLDNDPSGEA
jgi:chromosomal replication initiation ATPase DnaA